MSDLVVLLVLSLFFSVGYEFSRERWLGVFAWIAWWLFALVWFKTAENWVLSLIAFAAGLIYFIRMLLEAVQPGKIKKIIARMST